LTFYPHKKVAPPLIKVEKKFSKNWAYRVSKEADLKNFANRLFSEKKFWELLDARVLHISEISAIRDDAIFVKVKRSIFKKRFL
jgi:hypothetical protein